MKTFARPGLCRVLLGSLALALSSTGIRAQQGFKEALPEHTLFYAAAPDLNGWYEGFKSSPVHKIWSEEEVQEFLADLMAEGKKYYTMYMGMAKQQHEAGRLPFDPAKLEQIRLKGVSLAVTDLVLPGGQKPAAISLVGCIDFGDSAKVVQEAAAIVLGMAQQQAGDDMRLESKDVPGGKLHMVLPPESAAEFSQMLPTFGLCWGFIGNNMLFGTDVDRVTQVAGALTGDRPAKSLTDSATYNGVAQRIGAGKSDVEVYLRPDACFDVLVGGLRFAAQMDPSMSEQVDIDGIDRVIDSLGLRSLKAIGCASGYEGGKGFFNTFLASPEQERKGLMSLVSGGPIDQGHMAWIPKDVGSFSIAQLGDLEKVYTAIMDAVGAYDEGVGKLVDEKLREAEQGLELNIKKDIFGAFGGELIAYSMPVTGLMATPEMVFMLGCKNPDRTLEVLNRLCQLSEGVVAINESKTDDGVFYTVDLMLDDMGMGMDPTGMMDPTFAFKNGFLVFGLSRADVKGALKRFDSAGQGDDVRSNPAFKPYVGQIPEKVESLAFTDVASTVDGIYGTLSGVLGMVPIPPDVPIDLGLLPSVDTLTKHLFGSVTWSTTGKDGISSRNVGPLGPEMVMALGAGIVVGGAALAWVSGRRPTRVRRIGR